MELRNDSEPAQSRGPCSQKAGRCLSIALLTATAPLEGDRKEHELVILIPGSPESVPEWSPISRRNQSLVVVYFRAPGMAPFCRLGGQSVRE